MNIYVGVLEVAAELALATLNRPLGDAVKESLEKSIRFTVDTGPGAPPPNQP